MKEIYVYKSMFRGWKGLTKKEVEEKLEEGYVFGVELETKIDQDTSEPLKITLLKDHIGIFEPSENEIKLLIKEYFDYLEEITGIVVPYQA